MVVGAFGLALVTGCAVESESLDDLAFRSGSTDWEATDASGAASSSTSGPSSSSSTSSSTTTSTTSGGDTNGGDTNGGDSTSGGYTGSGGDTGCGDAPPCVPARLDEAQALVPDNDAGGAGAVGCPTAQMTATIDGPTAGMSCDGAGCKFTYKLVLSSIMHPALLQDWNDTHKPPGPDGNKNTSDCPTDNPATKTFLAAFGAMSAAGQASAKVEGNAMACSWAAANEELTCTFEIPVTCTDYQCTGGKDTPYKVEVWLETPGTPAPHRRTLTTTFQAEVTPTDDCDCTIGAVTATVSAEFTYITKLPDGTTKKWNPTTFAWEPVP